MMQSTSSLSSSGIEADVPEERVQLELLRDLRSRAPEDCWLVLLGHTGLIGLVSALVWDHVGHPTMIGWIIAVLVTTSIRSLWVRKASRSTLSDRGFVIGIRIVTLLQGLSWGVSAAIALPMIPAEHDATVIVVLAGIIAGSLSTLAADPPSFLLFHLAILGPVPIGLLLSPKDETQQVLLCIVLMFAGVMFTLSRRVHRGLLEKTRTIALLSVTEQRISLLFQSTAEGIYGVNPAGICIFCNQSGLRLLGFNQPSEVLGRNMHDLAHHSSRDGSPIRAEDCVIAAAARLGQDVHGDDVYFWRADGTGFPVEYWSHSILSDGIVVGAVFTFLDISERKATEQALKDSEARFRGVAESNILAISYWLPDGTVTDANDEFLRMLGFSRRELQDGLVNWRQFAAPEYMVEDEAAIKDVLAGGTRSQLERELIRKDGVRVPILLGLAPLGHPNQGGVAFIVDMTERKRAEGLDRWKTALLEAQIRSSIDGILVVDEQGKKIVQNPRLKELWGIPDSMTDSDDRTQVEFVLRRTKDPVAFLARVEHLYAHRDESGRDEIEFKDGTVLDRYSAPVMGSGGEYYGRIWTFHDVTEHKQVVEKMREARDLAERSAETRSMFLANMSHEIRTPMNAILGMVELVLDTDLSAEQRGSLELVRASAESLLSILNDVLDYSKIEAGHLDIEAIPFELHKLIHSTTSLLAVRAREKNLELLPDISNEVSAWVSGDPSRLRQVLSNLLSNAIKFTEAGEVIVAARAAVTDEGRPAVHFSVRDTGIGIPADRLGSIFDEFTQADGTTSRRYGGTGLGLTIAQRLVGLMGGTITVASQRGVGSEFSFTLPLQAITDPSAARPGASVSLAGRRFLVVDDNSNNRRICRDMLAAEGARVDEAADIASALSALREARNDKSGYSLAIIDVWMPVHDGFELVVEIRRDPAIPPIAIVMMTTSGQRGDAARCRELGVSGYLTKPVSRSDLIETVVAVLDGPKTNGADAQIVTRHSLTETRQPLKILLVEDNAVNRLVASKMLRQRGHKLETATNGLEAVEAVRLVSYDMVLMDVQMPEMDGFEATAAIRALGDRGRVPIIALTAHALSGERELCLSHGMDGYLAKPFKSHELFAMVEGWKSRKSVLVGAGASQPESVAVDVEMLRRQLREAGSESALAEILDAFLASIPERLAAVRVALNSGSAAEVALSAHAFKSSAGAVGARPLAELLAEVESAGRTNVLENRSGLGDRVEAAVALVLSDLNAFRAQVTAPAVDDSLTVGSL
ncbi:MAG: response regulator [Gemmatimonadota bacterium]